MSLVLLGVVSACGYAAAVQLFHVTHGVERLPWMIALFMALSVAWGTALLAVRRSTVGPATIIGFAVLFQLIALPSGYAPDGSGFERLLLYEDRVWRYLWEGHAWSIGLNPLEAPPEAGFDLVIDAHGDRDPWARVLDNVSNRELPSPYPIGAQALFMVAHTLAPGSVLAWKLMMVGFDLVALFCVWRFARQRQLGLLPLVAYGWNPLVIKEFAGSGHVDAALVASLAVALVSRPVTGSLLVAAAGLVKPIAWLVAPALIKRGGWSALVAPAIAAVAAAVFLPHGAVGYVFDWTSNAALYALFPLPRAGLMLFATLVLGALVTLWWRVDDGSPQSLARYGVLVLGGLLVVMPVVNPWYVTTVLPFAALTGSPLWLAASGSVWLAYASLATGQEAPLLLLIEFSVPLLVWWIALRRQASSTNDAVSIPTFSLVSTSLASAAIGGLCCLTPIALFLLGLSSVSAAAGLGEVLYGEYRWVFRVLALVSGAAALVILFRQRGVCSIDAAMRRRAAIVDVALLTLFGSGTAYVFFTYVVLQSWGIGVGLPWAQYDETWAVSVGFAWLVLAAGIFVATRRPTRQARSTAADRPEASRQGRVA